MEMMLSITGVIDAGFNHLSNLTGIMTMQNNKNASANFSYLVLKAPSIKSLFQTFKTYHFLFLPHLFCRLLIVHKIIMLVDKLPIVTCFTA